MKPIFRLAPILLPFVIASLYGFVSVAAEEQSTAPGQSFKDCPTDCPEMVVVPSGSFVMGSPDTEGSRQSSESPRHQVTIGKPLAVAKFELTFSEWDACAAQGDCDRQISDSGFGRGQQPAINVSWAGAQRYVSWLSRIAGKPYRLLSEAEYEYAARAGTKTAYPWGDEVGSNNANCTGCGSRWDGHQTAPVGSFAPNRFGLYGMVGNVWEWVEDCWHGDYAHAPSDGSAWTSGDCSRHSIRGGSWSSIADELRSANRSRSATDDRYNIIGFRVGRTLAP